MAETITVPNVFNNVGQTTIQSGNINVAEVVGIANPAFTINGQQYPLVNAVSEFQFKKLIENSYDDSWNKGIKVRETGNEGTVQYTFMPVALPVSNFTQSDIGNRSFGTKANVWGKNMMVLQTNFWTNEYVALTDRDYIDSIQKQLIGTYAKSIAIMKNELSLIENAIYCLATGQFYFADEIGKKISGDPLDPNNIDNGELNILWTLQKPRLTPDVNTILGGTSNFFLKQELSKISAWLMTWTMSLTQFNIGFSLNRLSVVASNYFRNNLAQALDMGWPTQTNMDMVKNSSFVSPTLSRWFNLLLTDTDTTPLLQNEVPMVSPEILPNGDNAGQPLGYGINNICNMSYLKNVIGMTTFDGAMEQYYTTNVPFNPYNLGGKTWYRLGYAWGWGQVHIPNYWGTSYMFLDPSAYINITNFSTAAAPAGATNKDWTVTSSSSTTNNDPIYTVEKTLNGIIYTATYQMLINQLLTDMTQAQAWELYMEPGMKYDLYAFPSLPTQITDTISGNVANLTFLQWATYSSFFGLNKSLTVDGKQQKIFDLRKVGYNQLTFAPFTIPWTYPVGTPIPS